jgi:hypothetical protein
VSSERVSDADRERALVDLREHLAAGRLAVDELEERSGRVVAARTRAELAAALADLPRLDGLADRSARCRSGGTWRCSPSSTPRCSWTGS